MKSEDINKNVLLPIFFMTSLLSKTHTTKIYQHEPEFYKFADERSPEMFQIGQCWAIYNDEDALPRYYRQIKKIDILPEFVLHVALFYACQFPKIAAEPLKKGEYKIFPRASEVWTVYKSWSAQLMKDVKFLTF
ncbi:hypothetical protein KY289_030688 [Solanum tuberosum]|nr:hypothetical protein KY289_030688 [Solanum tuberosum]